MIISCFVWGAAGNEFQLFSFLAFFLKNINLKIKSFLHTLSIIQSIILCIYQNCLYMNSIKPLHYTFFWGITVSPKFWKEGFRKKKVLRGTKCTILATCPVFLLWRQRSVPNFEKPWLKKNDCLGAYKISLPQIFAWGAHCVFAEEDFAK